MRVPSGSRRRSALHLRSEAFARPLELTMAASTGRRREYEVVGNYELIRPLGEGGTARVFLARHRETGAEVVLKRMHAERANDPAFRRIFQSELRTLMRFRHPGAVGLLDASRDDEAQPFVVMEFIHG